MILLIDEESIAPGKDAVVWEALRQIVEILERAAKEIDAIRRIAGSGRRTRGQRNSATSIAPLPVPRRFSAYRRWSRASR